MDVEIELSHQEAELLKKLCALKGIPLDEAIRKAIDHYLKSHPLANVERLKI